MTPILPGATVGVLGGGQLARMLALEGRRMGYRFAVLDPDPRAAGMQLADERVVGRFDDAAAAQRLAEVAAVITLDTEHIPAAVLSAVEARCPVRPAAAVLAIVQDRWRQRQFLAQLGAPQPRCALVDSPDSLSRAAAQVGFPAVLKATRLGYDGKGQRYVADSDDLPAAWQSLDHQPAVLESFVALEREVAVLLARAAGGEMRCFPLAENTHRRHILSLTRVPARLSPAQAERARELAEQIAAGLGVVGMLAVELFVTAGGELLVNELAPRVHNSGHYTFGACATSQFEQHLRAICGLPLGDPSLLRPAAMLNLLGDLWEAGEPDWSVVFAHPNARLHLYGKAPRPARKVGHILVLDEDAERAEAIARDLDAQLGARLRCGDQMNTGPSTFPGARGTTSAGGWDG